jgi:hypothetical protein
MNFTRTSAAQRKLNLLNIGYESFWFTIFSMSFTLVSVGVQGGYAGDGLVGAEDQYSPDYL